MTMQTDVKSSNLTSTGDVFAGRGRVKAISYRGDGTAGSLVLTDGSGGDTLITLTVGSGDTTNEYVLIPGEGVLFRVGIYATLTHVASVTVFYG